MRNVYFFLIIALSITSNSLFSQKYFQQEVNYKINVTLNDSVHEFSAFETVEYINNSPDNLEFIYFHIWPNAYDNNETALAKQKLEGSWKKLFTIEEQRGYIDSLDFKVDGKKVKWEYDNEHIDICKIFLDQPLKSGERVEISTPFHVKIPKGVTSRMGHIKQSYQITQWYPKPAVYDNKGWHQMPYLNMGEFYSEFGSYDVSITLPKNYIVGATGDLQNSEEIEWMNSLAEKTAKIDSFDRKVDSFPISSKEFKTLRFKQEKVHDFAWFADKRFHVLKGEREMPATGKKVTLWAMFLNSEAHLWKNSLEYIGDALYYYSSYTGDYPYNQCTALHSALSAGGGMEYPNVTVIGNSGSPMSLEMVIMHEVGHNWFYGILGFNEREYPWMDEGLNSFCEARYMRDKYGEEDCFYKMIGKDKIGIAKFFGFDKMRYKKMQELTYLFTSRYNFDQNPSLSSEEFTDMNYGAIVYSKTARVFDHLLGYLGEERFDKVMKYFYEDWKYKHPYPEDIRNAFEKGTGEDLSWLFDDLLQTTKKMDYKFTGVNKSEFTLNNKGDIVAPVNVTAFKNNEIIFSSWYDGFNGKKTFDVDLSKADKLIIDPEEYMVEFARNNNTIRTSGIFKKTEPLSFKLAGVIENTEKTQINFIPAMGWNNYNKYMLGLVFYSPIIPRNRFEYQIMPMYSFGANDIAGSVNLAYNIMPYNSNIRNIKLKASAKQYAYNNAQGDNFQKYTIGANFLFRNSYARSKVRNNLIANAIMASDNEDIIAGVNPKLNQYYNINFKHRNNRKFHPYSISAGAQINTDFVKTNIEGTYEIIFAKKKKKIIDFRLYAGAFLYKADNLSPLYNINLSGTSGIEDYTYDQTFLGRYENPSNGSFLSNQFVSNQGGFSIYTPHGKTNEWLVSLNVSSDIPYLPKAIPLKVYANAAVFGNVQPVTGYTGLDNYAWEAGVKLSMANNNIQIFVPIFMSKDLTNISDDNYSNYSQRIRFTFNLNAFNPANILENNFN